MDEDPALFLRLGQPRVGVEPINWYQLEQYLSPDFQLHLPYQTPIQKIESRILCENLLNGPQNLQRPLAEAEQVFELKK